MKILKNYYLLTLLIIVYGLLVVASVQGQTPEIEVTLTWSTDTYAPLNYLGKSLPIEGSMIEIAANIDSQEFNYLTLTYNWFINNQLQESDSGLGKNVFKFKLKRSINQEYGIRLEVENKEKTLFAVSYVSISSTKPEVVLSIPQDYQFQANQEIEITAQPYFFNINNINELDYSWSLNGKSAFKTNDSNLNTIILKIGQISQSIKQKLTVWAENKNNSLQKAQTEIEITFTP